MLTQSLNLDRFAQKELTQEPFDYLILNDFIQTDSLEKIHADFPMMSKRGSFPLGTLDYGPHFKTLMDELQGPAFKQAVEKKFSIDLSERPTMVTVRGQTSNRDGHIHTDSKTKVITVLLYLNESWQADEGCLRLLRNGHDLEDYIAEIPPKAGTLLVFRCSDNAWHGHKPFIGERRSIQLNWVTSDAVVKREQTRHGFSARVKGFLALIARKRLNYTQSV